MRSVNSSLNEHSRFTSVSSMEDLILSSKEHRLLKKFKKKLQKQYGVQIRMPEDSSCDSDIIFVSMLGDEKNRECVKEFLSKKMIEVEKKNTEENIPVITLSDSESSEDESSNDEVDESVIEIPPDVSPKPVETAKPDDSVCILGFISPESSNAAAAVPIRRKRRKKRKRNPSGGDNPNSIKCPYFKLSQADYMNIEMASQKKARLEESIEIVEEVEKPAVDFIPLRQKENRKPLHKKEKSKNKMNKKAEDVIVVSESVPPAIPRKLRPIVIDGSNVAREHGRTTNSFSVKGIQIAIDYFLKRGHTEVTAFVPRYRRNNNPKRFIPTTDASILDDLEKKGQVVFTPSRVVQKERIASYDDRYIVKLAAANGGVIVSNDNYRDLINENESYREAIEKRLLMFCFVGDMFMVPDDPLGRKGPNLNDFLSFPPDESKT